MTSDGLDAVAPDGRDAEAPDGRRAAPIVIIGGGISGLAIAHEVRRRDPGRPLVVLEASPRAGGLLFSDRRDGWLCEQAANSFLDSEGEMGGPSLARELGVELAAASPAAKRRWIWRRGALRRVPAGPPDLLATDLLSWRAKLRLLLEPFARRAREPEESVAAFARRRLGGEVAEAVLAPFVTGIYAGDAEKLSVTAALPRLADLEARHGSLFRGLLASRRKGRRSMPSLVAPRAGVAALPEALAAQLGPIVRVNARVVALDTSAGGPAGARGSRVAIVRLADGTSIEAGALALAVPPAVAATLVEAHDRILAERLRTFETVGVIVVHAGFERRHVPHPLDGFGFLVAPGESLRCLGCLFESSVWPERAPEGHVLLRLIYGGARDPSALRLDDAELGRAVAEDLRASLGIIESPRFFRRLRLAATLPQYHVGHHGRVAEVERRATDLGLVLAGNAYHGIAVNDCVKDAARVAQRLVDR